MFKKVLTFALAAIMALGVTTTVFAAYNSTLEYKGVKATAELTPTFKLAILGSDKATAITEFTTQNNGYRVAVRLERWDDSSAMSDYKYDSDSTIAQCNYTWTDVYCFKSRHSIDNSTNTTEYSVDAFNAKE